jgi:hypothetical protein
VNLILPISFFVICGFLVVLPVFVTPMLVVVDCLILFVGVIFYLVFIRWKSKPEVVRKMLCEHYHVRVAILSTFIKLDDLLGGAVRRLIAISLVFG